MVRAVNYLKSKTVFRELFRLVSRLLSALPSRQDVVIYGSMNGNFYGDNARHQFEYNSRVDKKRQHYWMTKSIATRLKLASQGYSVVLMWMPRGVYLSMNARFGFYTDSLGDLALYPDLINKAVKLIALRHGRSVKRVRFARLGHKISTKEHEERRYEGSLIEHVISTSSFVSKIQEECLRVGIEKHVVTGYPRNDELIEKKAYSGKTKKILYAPTWRHGRGLTRFFPWTDFDFDLLKAILEEENFVLHARPHATELYGDEIARIKKEFAGCPHFAILDQKIEPDINSVLHEYDVLITDYSALYHDFLLLDRPIIFIPYDYDDFATQNGFLYNYFDHLPGVNVQSAQEFYSCIRDVARGADNHQKQRQQLSSLIHEYTDSNSRRRILELIQDD